MGTQLPSPETGAEPQLSAHVRCGKTAGWIKISLDKEVGLGLGDFVLDVDRSPPPERGTAAPSFWPMPIVAKRSLISATAELLLSCYKYTLRVLVPLMSARRKPWL